MRPERGVGSQVSARLLPRLKMKLWTLTLLVVIAGLLVLAAFVRAGRPAPEFDPNNIPGLGISAIPKR